MNRAKGVISRRPTLPPQRWAERTRALRPRNAIPAALFTIVALVTSLTSQTATAVGLEEFHASQAAPLGQFTDVAFVGSARVYSGYELNPFNFTQVATLYTVTGLPGSNPATQQTLGHTTFYPSVATSIAWKPGSGFHVTAVQLRPNEVFHSFIHQSGDLLNPVQVLGPGSDPNVALLAINWDGIAAGDEAGLYPLISDAAGTSARLDHPEDARATSIDSTSSSVGGFSTPPELSGEPAATVWDSSNAIVYQDTVAGVIWDVEGQYAVGTRNGKAAFWRRAGNSYVPELVRDAFGTSLPGELLAIDHAGLPLAGGYLEDGRAIVVNVASGEWIDVESKLSITPGTLNSVVGIQSLGGQVAMAVTGSDGSGWDVTADITATPGPGGLLALPLLLMGAAALSKRH